MTSPHDHDDELSPEAEAIVAQFTEQLDGAGQTRYYIGTEVGPIEINNQDREKIREAAVAQAIKVIQDEPKEPRPLHLKVASWALSGGFVAGILIAVAGGIKLLFN